MAWRLWGRFAQTGPTDLTDPLQFLTGGVFWVDSLNGNDANTGKIKEKPKLTIESAIGAVTVPGSRIILKPGFSQNKTSVSPLAVPGLRIIGEGEGVQQAVIRRTAAAGLFSVIAKGVVFDNIHFPESTVDSATPRISVPSIGSATVKDCLVELGTLDSLGPTMRVLDADALLTGTTFRVTSGHPVQALLQDASTAGFTVDVDTCLFDGGVFGWADDGSGHQVAVEVASGTFRMRRTLLRNHSDVFIQNDTATAVADIAFTVASDLGEDCSVLFEDGAPPE